MKTLSCSLLVIALMSSPTIAAAQGIGGGQTTTPQSATNPDDPAVRNPQSPTAGNRGDPGSEAANPQAGGPALGQGQQPPATVGQSATDRQVVPPNAQPDDAAVPVTPREVNPGNVGAGSRIIPPEGARNDPHTLGGKDAPIPDATRPTMAPTPGR